jgi:hypothetical protein
MTPARSGNAAAMDRDKGSVLRRMRDRPDYVPSHWTGGSLNTWTAAKPSRVLAFFGLILALDIAMLAWMIFDPGAWTTHPGPLLIVPFATVALLYQALKYGPRAWRAMRRGA